MKTYKSKHPESVIDGFFISDMSFDELQDLATITIVNETGIDEDDPDFDWDLQHEQYEAFYHEVVQEIESGEDLSEAVSEFAPELTLTLTQDDWQDIFVELAKAKESDLDKDYIEPIYKKQEILDILNAV